MLKRVLCLLMVCLTFQMAAVVGVHAESKEAEQARFAEKVKENINKLGAGTDARVELKLRDKTKLKGYVSEIGEECFVVIRWKIRRC